MSRTRAASPCRDGTSPLGVGAEVRSSVVGVGPAEADPSTLPGQPPSADVEADQHGARFPAAASQPPAASSLRFASLGLGRSRAARAWAASGTWRTLPAVFVPRTVRRRRPRSTSARSRPAHSAGRRPVAAGGDSRQKGRRPRGGRRTFTPRPSRRRSATPRHSPVPPTPTGTERSSASTTRWRRTSARRRSSRSSVLSRSTKERLLGARAPRAGAW
jgi:hypothetical protein